MGLIESRAGYCSLNRDLFLCSIPLVQSLVLLFRHSFIYVVFSYSIKSCKHLLSITWFTTESIISPSRSLCPTPSLVNRIKQSQRIELT